LVGTYALCGIRPIDEIHLPETPIEPTFFWAFVQYLERVRVSNFILNTIWRIRMIQDATKFKLPEVFIVSSGRSGTTLLVSILNASEQIYVPYESDFIARAYPHYQHKENFTEADYKQISKIFKLSAKQDGWGMSEDYVVGLLHENAPQTFAEVNSVIYRAFHQQEKTDSLQWGIKAPVLIASLDRIHQVCPNAKIVHVIRDGRDVYLSYKKIHESSEIKFGPKGVIENALYWVDGLRRVEDFLKLNLTHQFFELRYDDLLNNPESILMQLCAFLEIEYKSSMHENFNECGRNKKVVPTHFRQSIHKKLYGGLDPNNARKYLNYMSVLEQIQYELIAIPYLIKYGYKPEYPVLNSFLFAPIRGVLYSLSRQFNDWRYTKRDRKIYKKACHI
jgi:hypothetical protein